jgi:tRNA G18 (ribose-2'-O)-methylase SpoU
MTGSKRTARRGVGFFGMVVYRAKSEINIGTLWRSAFLYDAAFIGTVGARYQRQASDTPGTTNHIPLMTYDTLDDLRDHLPYDCPLVGVELAGGACSLQRYCHPPRALYLLGAEDHGLSPTVLDQCHQVVQIPTVRDWSMNVAVAGSIVMYDRHSKMLDRRASTRANGSLVAGGV